MGNWHSILNETRELGSPFDVIRRKYLKSLYNYTKRNVIIYYSGWLQKPTTPGVSVNDADKNGFMNVIHKLNKDAGLDLILHTPGGDTAATESIVNYLHSIFGDNIRAVIPQLALSAGTIISCSCKEILMGKHSSLGPIDPQFNGIPAHGIVEEFKQAYDEIVIDLKKVHVWQPIIAKYNPTLIGECQKAIKWTEDMVYDWLTSNMLKAEPNKNVLAKAIIKELGDHALNLNHARHLSSQKCKDMGLKIVELESDQKLQDLILSVHHSCIQTLTGSIAYKIIENHNGIAFIQNQNIR